MFYLTVEVIAFSFGFAVAFVATGNSEAATANAFAQALTVGVGLVVLRVVDTKPIDVRLQSIEFGAYFLALMMPLLAMGVGSQSQYTSGGIPVFASWISLLFLFQKVGYEVYKDSKRR
jgi:hypothetical protein